MLENTDRRMTDPDRMSFIGLESTLDQGGGVRLWKMVRLLNMMKLLVAIATNTNIEPIPY